MTTLERTVRRRHREDTLFVHFNAWLGSLLACGCVLGWTRPEHAHAPKEYYQSAEQESAPCGRLVEIWERFPPTDRPYREIATISVTCYPGALTLCERRMRHRACELGADAVIAMEPQGTGTPPGSSLQSYVARSGKAIRYQR